MATAKYKKNKRGEFRTLVWDGKYNKDGSKHRKVLTSKKSSADLERKVAEFKETVNNNAPTEYSSESFYEYALRWLQTYKTAKEKNTQAMYRRIIETHLAALDDVMVSDIRHSHFQQIINKNLDYPRTCQQIALTFKQIVKCAMRDRILPRSALEDITGGISLPAYIRPEKRPLTALEREALEKADLDLRKRAFVSILYYFGLRRGEALALTRFDFNWDKMELSVNKALIFDNGRPELKSFPKSHNGIRKIPIPAEAVGRIKPFIESEDGPYLFHGQGEDMMTRSAFVRMWESIITSLNIAVGYNPQAKVNRHKPITDLTCHIFRHNYCTELCYQVPKISTKMIARLLGDNEKMVLDVYSHVVEEKEAVHETVNEIFCVTK